MSLSTLPELFKENNCRYNRPSKVGGVFSLHLTNANITSPQKNSSISKRQSTNGGKSQISGRRSSSSNALSKNIINLKGHSQHEGTKFGSFQQSLIKKRNSESTFSRDVSALQEIYYKNIIKAKIAPQIQTGFPFQTNHTMNNMGVNMEEADSMKNRFQLVQQSIQKQFHNLQNTKNQVEQIREQLSVFYISFQNSLNQMNQSFVKTLDECYKKLSKTRRQTNQQIKMSKKELEGISVQISDAGEVYKLLESRSNLMRNDCISDQKLELSQNTTYFKNNFVSTKKNSFIDIFDATNHKRASSIQGTRKKLADKINQQNRVSTTSQRKRFINNQKIKQEQQGEQNLFQGIQNGLYQNLNTNFHVRNSGIQNAFYKNLDINFPVRNEGLQNVLYENLNSNFPVRNQVMQNPLYENLNTNFPVRNEQMQNALYKGLNKKFPVRNEGIQNALYKDLNMNFPVRNQEIQNALYKGMNKKFAARNDRIHSNGKATYQKLGQQNQQQVEY